MTEQTVTREFSLGSGEVYIAGGSVPQSELEAKGIRARVTDGGCVLSCEYRVKELYDTDGRTADGIRSRCGATGLIYPTALTIRNISTDSFSCASARRCRTI